MKDFDLLSLRLFAAVCDAGSVQNVGEREHIDASSITKRLSKLEKEVGVKLLKRSAKGMIPTVEGLGFLHATRELLANANKLASYMQDFGVETTDTVEIIANPSIWSGFLPRDVGSFLNEPIHKKINVVIRDGNRFSVAEAVREGRASLGVSWDVNQLKGLHVRPYRSQRLAAFVHRSHPLSDKLKTTFKEVAKFDQVSIVSVRTNELELVSKKIIEPVTVNFRTIVPNFEIALRFAEMQVGILVAPLEMRLFVNTPTMAVVPLTDNAASRDYFVFVVAHILPLKSIF